MVSNPATQWRTRLKLNRIDAVRFEGGVIQHNSFTPKAVIEGLVELTHLKDFAQFKEGERDGDWTPQDLKGSEGKESSFERRSAPTAKV